MVEAKVLGICSPGVMSQPLFGGVPGVAGGIPTVVDQGRHRTKV